MKKRKELFNLTALMIAVLGMLCMFPQISNALEEVTIDECQICHVASPFPGILHDTHTGLDCLSCHNSAPGDAPVFSTRCVECHGNPVDVVAAAHEPLDSSCVVCHPASSASVISGTVSGCSACHPFDTAAGVTLTLSGDADDTATTADNGKIGRAS